MAAVTFGAMKDRISSETNRDSTEEVAAIGDAIVTAIRFHDRKRFWFTETNTTLTVSAAANTVSLPTDFRALINLRVLVNSQYIGKDGGFLPVSYEQLKNDETDPTRTGSPEEYSLFGSQIRVTPLADQAYTLDIDYTRGDTTYPSADGDTSIWLGDEGQDLIRNKAKAIFCRDTFGADDLAAFFESQAASYLNNLIIDNNTRDRSILNA